MSANLTIELKGLPEMQRAFDQLGKTLTQAKIRQALMPGARIIRDGIKSEVPVGSRVHYMYASAGLNSKAGGKKKGNGKGNKLKVLRPGNLKRSIGIKGRKGVPYLTIGPRKGGKSGADGFYAYMQEYGTATLPAQPFMRPGFEKSKAAAEAAIFKKMEDIIYTESKRMLG